MGDRRETTGANEFSSESDSTDMEEEGGNNLTVTGDNSGGEINRIGEGNEELVSDGDRESGEEDEESEGRIRRIKIGSWNCEGLFEKLGLNGVSEYINTLDIAVLGETFTFSSFDFNIKFGEFIALHEPAKKFNIRGRPSGGLVVLVRKTLERYITVIETKISHVISFKIAKECLNLAKDIIFIGTYVHPTDSVFYSDEDHDCTLEAVEQFMLDQLEDGEEYNYLLAGDLNARLGDWELDTNLDEEEEGEEGELLDRVVQDGIINDNGHKLIQICIAFKSTTLNGLKDKGFDGNFTFIGRRGSSTIDHFICSTELLEKVEDYNTGNRIESQHMPIEMVLKGENEEGVEGIGGEEEREVTNNRWKEIKREECNNILNKTSTLRGLEEAQEALEIGIDEGLDKFDKVMKEVNKPMNSTFRTKKESITNKKWFDRECEQKKKETRKALLGMNKINVKRKRQEYDRAKTNYLNKRIEYQRLIREKRKSYKKGMQEKLINARQDTKSFWTEIRRLSFRKSRLAKITIEQWGTHFNQVFNPNNEVLEEEVDGFRQGEEEREGFREEREQLNRELNVEEDEEGLDNEILREEIIRGIDKLKQGKAGGIDEVSAELLQLSKGKILEFLYKLFNIMFRTSSFPIRWATAIIVPLYKKGEVNNPDNYRGISLLSVTSKFFTGILNKRLYSWAEDNDKINIEQAGFRKSHSTIDHIYTIYNMASNCLYGRRRSKFYVCFVDFRKAFDTVNREVLWEVLERHGVSNKMLNMIKAIYNRVVAVIRYGNELTGKINCPMGVRQGCLLSPLLFTLLITELAHEISREGRHGYQFTPGALEIFTLLFADDIALTSTTPRGLQNQIDILKRGAERLGLVVNLDKTKILVFRKGGFLGRLERWHYGEERIEVVNKYKYLGYTLTTKLSVDIALAEHAGKAKGRIVSIFRALYKLGKIDLGIFFKLFDCQVKPMLLYGAEIWGMKKRDIIEKVHLFACKKLLGVSAKTPNSFIYFELNRYPLFVDARVRVYKYWVKLLGMEEGRIPKQAYRRELREMDKENGWGKLLKENLERMGMGNIWEGQEEVVAKRASKEFKQRQIDIFWQEEHSGMEESRSRRFVTYLSFKEGHEREEYLGNIRVPKFRRAITRFRFGITEIRANRRYTNPQASRQCPFCTQVETEIHFLIECPAYREFRNKYLMRYWISLNNVTLKDLVSNVNGDIVRSVATYIFYAMRWREQQ